MKKFVKWALVYMVLVIPFLWSAAARAEASDIIIDDSFTNEDGNCSSIYYKDGNWCFLDLQYDDTEYYVSANRVLELVKKISENKGVYLEIDNFPSTEEDVYVINHIGENIASHLMSYCLNYESDFDLTIEISKEVESVSMNIMGCGLGKITVKCPSGMGEYGRLAFGAEHPTTFVGNVSELYLNSGRGELHVEGDIDTINFYGLTSKGFGFFEGSVSVTGKASGVEYGEKDFVTDDLGTLPFDCIIKKFSNQTGDIIVNGELVCANESDNSTITEDMFTFEYCTHSEQGKQVWYVNLRPKDPDQGMYQTTVYLVSPYGNGAKEDFTVADIREGCNLYIGGTDACPNKTIVLPGNYGNITISEGWVELSGSSPQVMIFANKYRPDFGETAKIKFITSGTVEFLWIEGLCYGANISVEQGGKIGHGQRTPIRCEARMFGEISEPTVIMENGTMMIMTYGSCDEVGTGVLTPNENEVANLTDSEQVSIDIDFAGADKLTPDDGEEIKNAINAANYNPSSEVIDVIDLSVEGYNFDENGNLDESSFVNITELKGEVSFTFSVPDENSYAIVRLHEDGHGIEGQVIATEKGQESISFATNKFSKYVLVKLKEKTVTKKTQKLSIKENTITKTFGSKSFTLEVKNTGKGAFVFKSSDKNVAQVNKDGKVTIKGAGTATISVYAKETSKYKKSSTLKIKIKVNKASSTITLKTKKIKYTGKNIKIGKATIKGSAGKVTYTYYTDKKCKNMTTSKNSGATKTGGAPKKKGTYYVKATVAADRNYKGSTSTAVKLIITK